MSDLELVKMFAETNILELKQAYTKSYLKTVSAFANERNGKIIFGIADDGQIIGVNDESKIRQQIENAIHDSFTPIPNFDLETNVIDGKSIVILSVARGLAIPYLYKGKAYMRVDTSTFVADEFRMRKWFQEISNINFEEQLVDEVEGFSFEWLQRAFYEEMGIGEFTEGMLITLGLRKNGQFTNVGRFFSDENTYRFGVDIVKFGRNASEFVKRLRLTNQSIIKQFYDAMDFFDNYYHDYEVVEAGARISRVRLPRNAFREALANAIVHRDYQINANIQIEFWDDYIKITSPGGLTSDISEAQYLSGGISVPRNATIANIFYRLRIIETFGTGVGRIKSEYFSWGQTPKFKVSTNTIEVILPVINYDKKAMIDNRETEVIKLLEKMPQSRNQIQEVLGLSASTTKNLLLSLAEQNKIERFGKGKATKYRLI